MNVNLFKKVNKRRHRRLLNVVPEMFRLHEKIWDYFVYFNSTFIRKILYDIRKKFTHFFHEEEDEEEGESTPMDGIFIAYNKFHKDFTTTLEDILYSLIYFSECDEDEAVDLESDYDGEEGAGLTYKIIRLFNIVKNQIYIIIGEIKDFWCKLPVDSEQKEGYEKIYRVISDLKELRTDLFKMIKNFAILFTNN